MLSPYISQTEKASLQLTIAPLICSVRPMYYDIKKTKAQPLLSHLDHVFGSGI